MRSFTLSRDTFHILVALADCDRHAYSILQEIAERTDGKVRLSASTLYSAIKRLLEAWLIAELKERPDREHDDERRRYGHRSTPRGRSPAGLPWLPVALSCRICEEDGRELCLVFTNWRAEQSVGGRGAAADDCLRQRE